MSDDTPKPDFEPEDGFVFEPIERPEDLEASLAPDVLADQRQPIGSSYDPMPLAGQVDTSRNWFGVVSLILGLLGGSIIAIVFGVLGLNAVKNGKATNRGLNIAGIVLGFIGVAATVVGITIAVANAPDYGVDASPGDCYISTLSTTADFAAEPEFGGCLAQSTGQVYYVTTYGGIAVPGDEKFVEDIATVCTTDAALRHVDTALATEYFVEFYVPFADEWDSQPHTVICGLTTDGEPINPDVVNG